jgi:hypothetical protein
MKLGFSFLEELLTRNNQNLSDLSEILAITPQAIQGWKSAAKIPTKRASQIVDHFKLGSVEIDQLLGITPLKVEFRTRRGEHLNDINVSESIKVRTQTVFERFFDTDQKKGTYDLSNLCKAILEVKDDFFQIAVSIRKEFTIPDYRPLGSDDLFALQARIGVKSLYLPFRQIGLKTNQIGDDYGQTAVLFNKGDSYSILIDSDRTVDEAHFDKTHEMLHVIFGHIFKQSIELEKQIDQISGELIYPRRFIVEQFFNNDVSSKPVKNKEFLRSKFYELTRSLRHILSPRGVARAMRDVDLTTRNSELFEFFFSELHAEFREKSVTYSSYGNMNFDFSNREKLQEFYETVVEKIENAGFYPLFSKLKNDLMSGVIQPSDFADTFNLKHSDALILKSSWEENSG